MREFVTGMSLFFVSYLVVYSVYAFIVMIKGTVFLHQFQSRRKFRNHLHHDYYVPISILIPAQTEDKNIAKTVQSLLGLRYKLYEIVVIDDSLDYKTREAFIKKFDMKPVDRPIQKRLETKEVSHIYQSVIEDVRITLLKKDQGGIIDAIHAGINVAEYPYFTCLNPNSSLAEDALQKLAQPILEDDKILFCRGFVKVVRDGDLYKKSLYKKKYMNGFLVGTSNLENIYFYHGDTERSFFPQFDLFQKDVVVKLGGYDLKGCGENFELARKIEDYCSENQSEHLIKYAPDAFCFVASYHNLTTFFKQRKKWARSFRHLFFYSHSNGVKWLCSLLYDFLAPIIILLSGIALLVGSFNQIIDFYPILLFLGAYIVLMSAIYSHLCILRIRSEKMKVSIIDAVVIFFYSILEVTIFQFLTFGAKLVSFFF